MDKAAVIKLALDVGGSEFKKASGNDHRRINHYFEFTVDELIEFAIAIRKQTCNEACERTNEDHVKEMLCSIANGY